MLRRRAILALSDLLGLRLGPWGLMFGWWGNALLSAVLFLPGCDLSDRAMLIHCFNLFLKRSMIGGSISKETKRPRHEVAPKSEQKATRVHDDVQKPIV